MPLAAVNTSGLAGKEAEQIQMIVSILNSKSHYEVLGVGHDAVEAEIKSVYKKMVVKVHPDKISSEFDERDKSKAQQAFRAVQNAYEVLSVPQQRRTYDHQLKEQAREGKAFVPGEDGAAQSTGETNSAGEFFGKLIGIILSMVIHVVVSVYNDLNVPFSAQALPFHFMWSSFVLLWKILGYGFFYSLLGCLAVYGVYRLVPHQQAKEAFWYMVKMQQAKWREKEGQPLHIALVVMLFMFFLRDFSFFGSLFTAFFVFGTLLLAFVMPQMTFGKIGAESVFIGLELVMVLYAPIDVHAAVFFGVAAWHLMQEVPSACIYSILLSVVYLTFRFSPALVLAALCVAIVAIGNHPDVVAVVGAVAAVISWYNYGFVALVYTFCFVYGLRRAVLGQDKGKRLALTSLIIWCLGFGWFLAVVVAVIIFLGGEFLVHAQRSEEQEQRGAHATPPGRSAGHHEASEGAGAAHAKGGKKGRQGKK